MVVQVIELLAGKAIHLENVEVHPNSGDELEGCHGIDQADRG